jgi:dihydrofolate reductase
MRVNGNDVDRLADAWRGLGEALQREGQVDSSQAAYRQAVTLVDRVAERRLQADILLAMGSQRLRANMNDSALRYVQRGRDLRFALGDSAGARRTWNNTGAAHYQLGNYEQALGAFPAARLRDAVAAARATGNPAILGYALNTLAQVYVDTRQFALAYRTIDASLAAYSSNAPKVPGADSLGGWRLNATVRTEALLRQARALEAIPRLDSLRCGPPTASGSATTGATGRRSSPTSPAISTRRSVTPFAPRATPPSMASCGAQGRSPPLRWCPPQRAGMVRATEFWPGTSPPRTCMATVYYTAATLDGFIADETHSLDWLMQFPDESGASDFPVFNARIGALCMGARTYEWMWQHHIGPGAPQPMPWPYAQPTWVFAHRAYDAPPGAAVHFVQGDVRPAHTAMSAAAAGRDLWVVGGGELAAQFHDAGLLDEIIVTIAGVTLGRGMPLFPRRLVTPPLTLKAVRQMGTAFVQLHYTVPPVSGTAAAPVRP